MLKKEEILSRTNNGLSVFKHYLPGEWRIGRHFLNPLYEDRKASCNIYFDRHSGMYKMKDFGNDNYSGDCFFLVGQLKGLDCNRALDFIEILETIDRDLGLGLSSGTPVPISQTTDKRLAANTPVEPPEKPVKPYQFREQKFSSAEMEYWRQYGITPEVLEHYKVCSLREYSSETAEGKFHRRQNRCTATRANSISSCTVPFPHPVSYMAAASGKTTVSDWSNCPPKVTHCLSRVARRTYFHWRHMAFMPSASTVKR